jgi:hypothetical protein
MVVCEFTNHGLRKFSYEFHPTALRHQGGRSAHSGFPQAVGRMHDPHGCEPITGQFRAGTPPFDMV